MSSETLIHERVALARRGQNETVIARMRSGWLVLGDRQFIPGYCLLLPDPVVASLNDLGHEARASFLTDMAAIGDALLEVTDAHRINYSILGNADEALHAHVFPRYRTEPQEYVRRPVWTYSRERRSSVPFDLSRDRPLMDAIRQVLVHRGAVIDVARPLPEPAVIAIPPAEASPVRPELLVRAAQHWVVVQRADATLPGYLIVAAKRASARRIEDALPGALAELGPLLGEVAGAVREVLRPCHLHICLFGSEPGFSVHFHVIPIYDWVREAYERAVRERATEIEYPELLDGASLTLFVSEEFARGRAPCPVPEPDVGEAILRLRRALSGGR